MKIIVVEDLFRKTTSALHCIKSKFTQKSLLFGANCMMSLSIFSGACSALSVCARYLPSTGYTWIFNESDESKINNSADAIDPVVSLMKLNKRMKRRKILDNRKAGERNEAEEEGLRSSAAIDQILVRLSKNSHLTATPSIEDLASSYNQNYRGSTIAVAEPPSSDDLVTGTNFETFSSDT